MTNKPLRVIIAIRSLKKAGAERYAADLSLALTKMGHTVKLVSFSDENEYSFITNQIDFQVCDSDVQLSVYKPHKVNLESWNSLVKKFKPQIIHTHLLKTEIITRYDLYEGVRYITTLHNNLDEFANWSLQVFFKKRLMTNLFEKNWIMKRYKLCRNHFIVISKDMEAYYKRNLPGSLSSNISTFANAIDFQRFGNYFRDRSEDFDEIRLVYVARFATYKNHIFLADVVKRIKENGQKVTIRLIGTGEEMDKVKRRFHDLGLKESVRFMGVVDNVESNLAWANIYVHPAVYEPFGLVIVEAMASGLPVVCLDGKGNRDLIHNGVNGYMQFDLDPEKFANTVMQLASNPEEYLRISNNAYEFAKSFDMDAHAEKMLQLYRKLVSEYE